MAYLQYVPTARRVPVAGDNYRVTDSPIDGTASGATPYIALLVYEMGKSGGRGVYYREDFVLVRAADPEQARASAEEHADREVAEFPDGSYVRLHGVIDVNTVLYPLDSGPTVGLYSRHFARIEDYESFEMFLGGRDPFE